MAFSTGTCNFYTEYCKVRKLDFVIICLSEKQPVCNCFKFKFATAFILTKTDCASELYCIQCTENNFAVKVDEQNFNFQTVIVENLPDAFNPKFNFKRKQESNQLGVCQSTCLTIPLRRVFAFRLSDSSTSSKY